MKTLTTQTQTHAHAHAQPEIYVTEADFEILSNLADTVADRTPGGRVLTGELARAVIVEPGETTRPFARIGSTLAYEDLSNGRTRQVRLTLPRDASIDDNRISVVTPVGAALIGMTVGESFHWSDAEGRSRGVRVLTLEA